MVLSTFLWFSYGTIFKPVLTTVACSAKRQRRPSWQSALQLTMPSCRSGRSPQPCSQRLLRALDARQDVAK